jgi:hypothetical protein
MNALISINVLLEYMAEEGHMNLKKYSDGYLFQLGMN